MSDSGRPLRVVLASVGSRGDVQPMLALGQTLRARGHAVLIAAPPNFADWAGALGFEFAPLGEDIQAFLAENRDIMTGRPLKMLSVINRYFRKQIPLQAQQLVPICRGADAIVGAGWRCAYPALPNTWVCPSCACCTATVCCPPASTRRPIFRGTACRAG